MDENTEELTADISNVRLDVFLANKTNFIS